MSRVRPRASVLTRDQVRAIRVGRAIKAGTVWLNRWVPVVRVLAQA